MALFLRIIQHLLPDAAAWRITLAKTLRKFFEGLAGFFAFPREFIDLVFWDFHPDTTRELERWEAQFGIPSNGSEDTRRERIAASWLTRGGQSKAYIEGVLASYGFTGVYLHEWWASGPPYVARDPHLVTQLPSSGLPPGYIVNKTRSGELPPPIPVDSARYPYFLYIGGATYPSSAQIPLSRRDELEALILRIAPAQHWLVFLVTWISDSSVTTDPGGVAGGPPIGTQAPGT